MRNFTDAIPPIGKAKKRTINGIESEIGYPPGWQDGTVINRDIMMALQGFDNTSTIFNADGSITEANALGETCVTRFNADGSITETFSAGAQQMTKTTYFDTDGKIREVLS